MVKNDSVPTLVLGTEEYSGWVAGSKSALFQWLGVWICICHGSWQKQNYIWLQKQKQRLRSQNMDNDTSQFEQLEHVNIWEKIRDFEFNCFESILWMRLNHLIQRQFSCNSSFSSLWKDSRWNVYFEAREPILRERCAGKIDEFLEREKTQNGLWPSQVPRLTLKKEVR